jgi:ankyrin repeat protein
VRLPSVARTQRPPRLHPGCHLCTCPCTSPQALLDRNDDALTQMTYAASEGDVDTVRALAARGLNLDAGDYDNRTTLHLAAAEGNARVVALLCQLGAKPGACARARPARTPS